MRSLRTPRPYCACVLLLSGFCAANGAQNWEAGFGGGGSLYLDRTLTAGNRTGQVGFDPGFYGSGWLGQDLFRYIGGEIRYSFLWNKMKVEASGSKITAGAQAHSFHYDVHFHLAPKSARTRPYLLAGGGGKLFRGTGQENAFQPLSNIAILTMTNQWQWMANFGAGVKWRAGRRTILRVEVRDQFSGFPADLLFPAPGLKRPKGGIHNFLFGAGIGYRF